MTETLFVIFSAGVAPFWLLLLLAPRSTWTERLVHSALAPALLGVAYVVMIALSGPELPEGAGFSSLAAVQLFFASPFGTLAGWVHFAVFDLFVGAWEVRDSQRCGIHHGLVVPCLILTLVFGPSGLLLYLLVRGVAKRRLLLSEEPPAP